MIHPAIIEKMNRERRQQEWQPVPLYIEIPADYRREERDDDDRPSRSSTITIEL